jgi:hypothetical protein
MAADTTKGTAVRKRQQIESANRTMFIWVIAAAAIIGVAIVLSISLFDRLVFNQKIINKKNETVANLQSNNKIVDQLKQNARVLNTNESLFATPRPDDREPISVILDALPSQANSSALGASLQQKLLNENVSVESLTVEPIDGAESGTTNGSASDGVQEINFTFTVSASAGDTGLQALKTVLNKLEHSIRTINVQSLTIEQQNSKVSMSVKGVAYYLLEKQVKLDTKSISPKSKVE